VMFAERENDPDLVELKELPGNGTSLITDHLNVHRELDELAALSRGSMLSNDVIEDNSDKVRLLDANTSLRGGNGGGETLEDIEKGLREFADPDDPCPQPPSYCTGCSPTRLLMSPMALLVLCLVGLTYYAYVVETDITVIELVIFHILVLLLLG